MQKRFLILSLSAFITLFITMFFPLYFYPNSPVKWINQTLFLTSYNFIDNETCVINNHNAICNKLNLNFVYNVNSRNQTCNILIDTNTLEVYKYYRNVTSISGFYNQDSYKCLEFYSVIHDSGFIWFYFALNFCVICFYVFLFYRYCKDTGYKRNSEDLEVLLNSNSFYVNNVREL